MRYSLTLIASAAFSLSLTSCAAGGTNAGQINEVLNIASQIALQSMGGNAAGGTGSISQLSNAEISQGLKQALAQGTRLAVNNLGQADGYWGNSAVRIPLPASLQRVETTMNQLGLGSLTQNFQMTLNRAAEQAVPVAANIFAGAVTQLTLQDVYTILTGPNDAATQYFRRVSSDALMQQFRPIVARATAQAGVTASYKQLVAQAGPLASLIGAPSDLEGYVAQKAIDGLMLQVASEEARIRANPAARTTEILQKVFGATR